MSEFADHIPRFLLPRLHLDRLGCQTSIRNLRKALDALPTKLNETYDDAMNRIHGQVLEHSQLALSALAWISNALRPLRLCELKEALAIQPKDHELDEEAIPEEVLMLSVSAGLITIDHESGTIRLVHFTVEEYFRNMKHQWFPHAHSQISETCLTYLSFDEFESGDCSSEEEYRARLEKNYLFEYAARNWGLHASRAENAIGDVALTFLLDKRKVSCASQFLMKEDVHPYRSVEHLSKQFTGLHLTAYFNVTDLAKRCLEVEPVVNPKDSEGRTPLSWAAERGNIAVVKLLLDRHDVEADCQDRFGRTPLSWAAETGQETVVKLLLDRDDVVAAWHDQWAWTPLSRAARNLHTAVVKLLIDRDDVVTDSRDTYGRTPLSWAAEAYWGREAHRLLLDRDKVVADSKDEEGYTPLYYAIKNGRERMIKLLQDRDVVAADYWDKQDLTPVEHAIECGDVGIVDACHWWTPSIHRRKDYPWMAGTSIDPSIHLVAIIYYQ